ncbi:MAG: TorD/DmsD family molecular chaperone [Planctomycetota bacterium]|jgi:TorA maturation chaperone TorD
MHIEQNGNEMDVTAENRSNSYGFLSIVYLREPTMEFIKSLRESNILDVLNRPDLHFNEQTPNEVSDKFLNDLELEYTRLFIGPGKHISPYESAYRGNGNALWGETTVAVKNFIESSGLEYSSNWFGLPDHIGVELEFMQRFTCREKEAWTQEDKETAIRCLEFEKKFIDEHLSQWVPIFCNKVKEETQVAFYGEIADLTRQFIDYDSKLIDKNLEIM